MIITRERIKAMFKGYQTIFNQAFKDTETTWQKIAMVVRSNSASETYGWLGKTTKFRKWLGDRVIQSLKTHGFTIVNEKYENTLGVDRDTIEDDKLGLLKPVFQQMGIDAKQHPEELVYELIKRGKTEKCYDGQNFFDTDHPVGLEGEEVSVSNYTAGSETPWYLMDVTQAIKPVIFQIRRDYDFVDVHDRLGEYHTFMRDEYVLGSDARVAAGFGLWQLAHLSEEALTPENFSKASAKMESLKSDNGKSLKVKPTLLVVPPALRKQALEIAKASRLENGKDNVLAGTIEVLVVPELA